MRLIARCIPVAGVGSWVRTDTYPSLTQDYNVTLSVFPTDVLKAADRVAFKFRPAMHDGSPDFSVFHHGINGPGLRLLRLAEFQKFS